MPLPLYAGLFVVAVAGFLAADASLHGWMRTAAMSAAALLCLGLPMMLVVLGNRADPRSKRNPMPKRGGR